MKKGPVCYVYYAIKNHRQSKLEQKDKILDYEKAPSQLKKYESH
jgi:hypothetical protein